MRHIAAVAALTWMLVGCGSGDEGPRPVETGEPFIQPQTCEELRCEASCIVDEGGGARCECPFGAFGLDCHPCPEGEQDWDGDGACTVDCLHAALDCGDGGYCDEFDGTASCVCAVGHEGAHCELCADGWQDQDGDGTCNETCAHAQLGCDRGTCDDTSGTPSCACDAGWTGPLCDTCEEGLQDLDLDGVCLPSCAAAGLECGHGECVDASGEARCACFAGWEGAACDRCREGLSDTDGDGFCTKDG